MKKLLILRHAKSSWKKKHVSDHSRPLNKRGKKSAPRMGRLLCEEDLVPDAIFSSTALRAVDTADLVAEACGFDGEVSYLDEFYHAIPGTFLDVLKTLTDDICTAMVVGHNPGMEFLLEELTDDSDVFPTAALALIELPIDNWRLLSEQTEGKLLQMWLPRALMD